MIKHLLETKLGHTITQSEFVEALAITDKDIKANNIHFKKRTYLNDLLLILAISHEISTRKIS